MNVKPSCRVYIIVMTFFNTPDMTSEPSMQHTHSASEALDHVATDGGFERPKLSAPLGCGEGMSSKRNFSAPSGALAKKQWKAAALKIKALPDPWEGLVQCRQLTCMVKSPLPMYCALLAWIRATLC